jgi:hypothetical protein
MVPRVETINAQRLLEFGRGVATHGALRLDESLPIPAVERIAWERRLNRYRRSCGCAEGAVGLCGGVAIVLIAVLLQAGPWTMSKIAACVLLPFGLLAGGKLIGRRLDRRRFRKACNQLSSRLATTD